MSCQNDVTAISAANLYATIPYSTMYLATQITKLSSVGAIAYGKQMCLLT
jgi:hypothetical protein